MKKNKQLPNPMKTMTTKEMVVRTFSLQNVIVDTMTNIETLQKYIDAPKEMSTLSYIAIVDKMVGTEWKTSAMSREKLMEKKSEYEDMAFLVRQKKLPSVRLELKKLKKKLKELIKDRDEWLDMCEKDYPDVWLAIWQAVQKLNEIRKQADDELDEDGR